MYRRLPPRKRRVLAAKDVFALANQPPVSFERAWEDRFDAAAKGVQGDALAEMRAARARRYIDYAFFHWRETGETALETWEARRRRGSGRRCQ